MRTTLRSDSQRGVTRPLLVLRRISESAGRASGATRTSERIRCGNQEPGVEVLELLILNVARRAPTPTQLGATARSRATLTRGHVQKVSPPVTEEDYS